MVDRKQMSASERIGISECGSFVVRKPIHQSRRGFVASLTASMAASMMGRGVAVCGASGSVPASEKITVGIIGLGARGFNLLDDFLKEASCRIVAVCDVDRQHHRDRNPGKGPLYGLVPGQQRVQSAYAREKSGTVAEGVATYRDYRELIQRPDVDAIVVATPDHWHALCTLEALRAGKDVYCEKPVTHLFAEGRQVVAEVAKRQRVFQTGSQQRSDAGFRRAVEIVRNGLTGGVRRVEVGLPPGYAMPQGDTQVVASRPDLDYDFWCGPSEVLPLMQARHHRWWRGHRAYGGGVLMDWIGHHNDIAHWALGVDRLGPERVEAVDWIFPETDVYNTPHHYTIRCEYAGGIVSTISSRHRSGLKITGETGWVWVDRGRIEASDARWLEPRFEPGSVTVTLSDSHVRNFLDCVRRRAECIAPADVGHRSITPGHLGYVSQQLQRALRWDAATETVIDDSEASRLLNDVQYREPWVWS